MAWVRLRNSTIHAPDTFMEYGRVHSRVAPDPVFRVDLELDMDYDALQSFLAYMREEYGVNVDRRHSPRGLYGPQLPEAPEPPRALPPANIIEGELVEDDDDER